jgi:hypothetical protein
MLYKSGGRDRSSYVGRRQSDGRRRIGKVRGGESNKTPLKSIRNRRQQVYCRYGVRESRVRIKKCASKRKNAKQDPFCSSEKNGLISSLQLTFFLLQSETQKARFSLPKKKSSILHPIFVSLPARFFYIILLHSFCFKTKKQFFASKEINSLNFASYFCFSSK